MSDEVITTPFGKFLIDPADLIGSTLKAGTLWDGPGFLQPIAQEYAALGERGVTVLDVGANQGAFSVWLASQGAWRVISVEPIPETMQRLKANLDLNKEVTANSVVPIEVAAYDRNTRLKLAAPVDRGNTGGAALIPTESGDERSFSTVFACPLDEFSWCFGERVSLIKIDAQGCDGRAMLGLALTIIKHEPAIVFEWEEDLARAHDQTLEQVIRWLTQNLNYTVEPWPTHLNNYLALPR
jgi:FkbM family methyltransferase